MQKGARVAFTLENSILCRYLNLHIQLWHISTFKDNPAALCGAFFIV